MKHNMSNILIGFSQEIVLSVRYPQKCGPGNMIMHKLFFYFYLSSVTGVWAGSEGSLVYSVQVEESMWEVYLIRSQAAGVLGNVRADTLA